jgi:hypothetical protein
MPGREGDDEIEIGASPGARDAQHHELARLVPER